MISRRRVGWLLLAGVAAVAGYFVFGNSDQRRVLTVLEHLAAAGSSLPNESQAAWQTRLRAALRTDAEPNVELRLPGMPTLEGADEIAGLWSNAEGARLRLEIEPADVRVNAEIGRAHV